MNKALRNINNITDFLAPNSNTMVMIKGQIIRQTGKCGTKIVKIMVPSNYLNNYWITLEMHLNK